MSQFKVNVPQLLCPVSIIDKKKPAVINDFVCVTINLNNLITINQTHGSNGKHIWSGLDAELNSDVSGFTLYDNQAKSAVKEITAGINV